jgi:hypothetical protein
MEIRKMAKYLLNCFILVLPVLIWNMIFFKSLPKSYAIDFFWKNIPPAIRYSENILRFMVILLPLLMKLSLNNSIQRTGFAIYVAGILLYFLSWLLQIYFPLSRWSMSMPGYLSPFYTVILWLMGIAMVGSTNFLKFNYFTQVYVFISVAFASVHSLHAFIVFKRL